MHCSALECLGSENAFDSVVVMLGVEGSSQHQVLSDVLKVVQRLIVKLSLDEYVPPLYLVTKGTQPVDPADKAASLHADPLI